MTVQQKRLMELSDFAAIALSCKECGTTVSIPMNRAGRFDRLRHCPTCHEDWLVSPVMAAKFESFVNSLASLCAAIDQRDAEGLPGFLLTLETNAAAGDA
jgi:hypothetical protein